MMISAMTDGQFAYFTPLDFDSVYTEKWEEHPPSPYCNLVMINGEQTTMLSSKYIVQD